MERLNNKLYEKYRDLKRRKISEDSERHAKVQAEFEKYLSVVENMVEELQKENNKLRTQMSSLEDQQAEYQRTLLEESQRVKELSSENELLRYQIPAEIHCKSKDRNMEVVPVEAPVGDFDASPQDINGQIIRSPNTRRIDLQHDSSDMIQHELLMPHCCRRSSSYIGDGRQENVGFCVYQMLIESLVGMKFSVENKTDGLCLSVTHQSSGYSFSLTWSWKTDEEAEMFYRVSSLGTVERVALDWMKEDLVFSTAMCRIFFERISRVLPRPT